MMLIIVILSLFVVGCGTSTTNDTLIISADVEYGENDYQHIVSSNNQLGFELLAKAPRDEDGNIFVSPTSLFIALAMIYNGADGETKKEMEKVLHLQGLNPDDLNKANASLMTKLNEKTDQIQLSIANSMWLNEKYDFQDDFASKNQNYFNAKLEEFDITDPQTPKMINDWVKQETNGKIDKIIENKLSDDLVAILMNAIYFKGNWSHPFDASLTEERSFTIEDGSTKELSLMELHADLFYMENDLFQAVSLPYGEEESMSMKVFLPKESVGIEELERKVTSDNWNQWLNGFSERKGTVLLPKFKLEYEVQLKEPLNALGMPSAFDQSANFSSLIKEELDFYISEVKQKTFIEVNEEGTEAAAVTSTKMGATAMPSVFEPFHMEVNRPFFIAIVDDTTDVILFMGLINNPK